MSAPAVVVDGRLVHSGSPADKEKGRAMAKNDI